MWEQLGWLDLDLMWVYDEVEGVQEKEVVVVDRDYGEVRLMCEVDEVFDDVDHDHCYFFHLELRKRAWKKKKKKNNLKWLWLVSLFPYLALSFPSKFGFCGVQDLASYV